jgi:hypothetical protein
MKYTALFLLIVLAGMLGCKRILLYTAGVRTPKEENKESLKEYIYKSGLDTNEIYIPTDTADFLKLNKISSSQSGYVFFNRKKEMLMYKDTGSACSAPVIVFVKSICATEHRLFYKKYDMTLITDKIKPLCNGIQNAGDYDSYVFIFWYKYFGKRKFKSDVIDIVNSIRKNDCRIKIYLVNLDLQPGWKKDIPIHIR